jgi:hypothetical protein
LFLLFNNLVEIADVAIREVVVFVNVQGIFEHADGFLDGFLFGFGIDADERRGR